MPDLLGRGRAAIAACAMGFSLFATAMVDSHTSAPTVAFATTMASPQFGTGDPSELVRYCDLAVRAFRRGQGVEALQHLVVADRISRKQPLKRDSSARVRAAQRGFFLISAWIRTARLDVPGADEVLRRARRDLADDVDVVMASGVVAEAWVRYAMASPDAPVVFRLRLDRWPLSDAAKYYQRVLVLDPTRVDARVRLAALGLIADPQRAHADLQSTVAIFDTLDPAQRARARRAEYLAHLFLGRLEADARRWPAAIDEFSRSIALCGAPQSARIGQAYALLMKGDERRARAQAKSVLQLTSATTVGDEATAAADPCHGDPWNEYAYGDAWRMSALVDEMREIVGTQP